MTTKCYDTIPDTNGEQISIVVPCPRAGAEQLDDDDARVDARPGRGR